MRPLVCVRLIGEALAASVLSVVDARTVLAAEKKITGSRALTVRSFIARKTLDALTREKKKQIAQWQRGHFVD